MKQSYQFEMMDVSQAFAHTFPGINGNNWYVVKRKCCYWLTDIMRKVHDLPIARLCLTTHQLANDEFVHKSGADFRCDSGCSDPR